MLAAGSVTPSWWQFGSNTCKSYTAQQDNDMLFHSQGQVCLLPVAYPGGGSGVQTPPPRNSEGPPKNRAKLNPIVITVKKIAEFRTPTQQDVPKKGSKILKLRRFSIVLH